MPFVPKSKLPRLSREHYQGRAVVLWTHTFEDRARGWLDESFHARFREILLHTCARHTLATPCYVLMPDHWHLVWMGLDDHSDHHTATAFLRQHVRPFLASVRLQDRAHDHVLRRDERDHDAFQSACAYVMQNPQRAGLRLDWRAWPHLGAMVTGYPSLDPRADDFWPAFRKIYNRLVDPCAHAQGHEDILA